MRLIIDRRGVDATDRDILESPLASYFQPHSTFDRARSGAEEEHNNNFDVHTVSDLKNSFLLHTSTAVETWCHKELEALGSAAHLVVGTNGDGVRAFNTHWRSPAHHS